MKSKEKALEIVQICNSSKECALKVVDLIILNYEFDMIQLPNENRMIDNINFWDKVKEELLKL